MLVLERCHLPSILDSSYRDHHTTLKDITLREETIVVYMALTVESVLRTLDHAMIMKTHKERRQFQFPYISKVDITPVKK